MGMSVKVWKKVNSQKLEKILDSWKKITWMLSLNKPQMTAVKVEPKTNFKFVLKRLEAEKILCFFFLNMEVQRSCSPNGTFSGSLCFPVFFKQHVLFFF